MLEPPPAMPPSGPRTTRSWRACVALALFLALPAGVQAGPADDALMDDAPGSEVVVSALALIGSPYRYGGRTPAGFDCSGFVGYVYGETLGVELPRRSEEMVRAGTELSREALTPGDLVFFNTLGRRYSHVGIFVGEGRFVHAPARGGRVRVERLADPYWSARYNGARRPVAAVQTQVVVIVEPAPGVMSGAAEDPPLP